MYVGPYRDLLQLLWFLSFPWEVALHVSVVVAFVWSTMGAAVLSVFFVFLLVIPLQSYFAKKVAKHKLGDDNNAGIFHVHVRISVLSCRKRRLKEMDKRVDVINEVVTAMRLVKMYCWEMKFSEKVAAVRKLEMKWIW